MASREKSEWQPPAVHRVRGRPGARPAVGRAAAPAGRPQGRGRRRRRQRYARRAAPRGGCAAPRGAPGDRWGPPARGGLRGSSVRRCGARGGSVMPASLRPAAGRVVVRVCGARRRGRACEYMHRTSRCNHLLPPAAPHQSAAGRTNACGRR
ncbi:MAG: hypothetical protein J3K34DRAFT_3815 [Monoraphidium minutum]|nr:MAG: hypothetical protein J3K34DRAFT_3815 [Monoraphidium minutum]